jgi:hypothetical protein
VLVIILKKARFFAPRRVETANHQTTSYVANQMRSGFSALNAKYGRMKIALEGNLHATIFPIIAYRISNKMCALLIEVLLFTISNV